MGCRHSAASKLALSGKLRRRGRRTDASVARLEFDAITTGLYVRGVSV